MDQKKPSRLQEIKETTSNTIEIIRQIGSPELQGTLTKVKETATIVNEMMQSLKTPEIVKNIENFRLISENMNDASAKIQSTMQQLKDTGMIEESTELIKFAKNKINSFGGSNSTGQDFHDVSTATTDMLVSINYLVNELKVTIESSKQSDTIRNIKETISDASDIYRKAIPQTN
ncbi:MAG TPA: hypothetical protein VMW55_05100 [Nitrosopumilaceae archaeon]|jgi:hypothetical protein|nr:hypothetical protein [Nitrosopumilaceae archaeon]